jgi:hypothetical protein
MVSVILYGLLKMLDLLFGFRPEPPPKPEPPARRRRRRR